MKRDHRKRRRGLNQDPVKLSRMRVLAGLSQAQLADKASVSRQHQSAMEAGERGASEEVLHRLAEAIGCEVVELMPDSPTAAVRREPVRS